MILESDLAAIERGICQPAEEAQCLADNSDIEWACANCPKKRSSDLSEYTHKLIRLHNLQKAGYPFKANDIAYEEWLDLGRVNQVLAPRQAGSCPMTAPRQDKE